MNEPKTVQESRIAELEQQVRGMWQTIEEYRLREFACYNALGFAYPNNDALPYLIEMLVQGQNKALAQRDKLVSSLQAQLAWSQSQLDIEDRRKEDTE